MSQLQDTKTTTSTADCEIVATRLFHAPRELVFRMWTDREHVSKACAIPCRRAGTARWTSLPSSWRERDEDPLSSAVVIGRGTRGALLPCWPRRESRLRCSRGLR